MNRRRGGTPPRRSRRKRELGRYKSSLEKYCADQLREYGIAFNYEEVEYTLQESFRYEAVYWKMTTGKKDMTNRSNSIVQPIRYTPDFTGVKHNWIIETKGFTPSQHTFPIRWKMFLKHLDEAGAPYPALFMPKNKQQVDFTVQTIKKLIDDGSV